MHTNPTLLYSLLVFGHRIVRGLANRLLPKKLIRPGAYSKMLLEQYGPLFSGSVINVSGWDDRDGMGGHYHDYFPNAKSYTVSNAPTAQKGIGSFEGKGHEIALDLSIPLPKELHGAYEVVYNNTTLEHVFEVEQAFDDLCLLSRDALVLVIPLIQQIHMTESYGDYWRFTTLGIAKMLLTRGFTTIVMETNDQPFAPIFAFVIAVRDPKKYEGKITPSLHFEMGGALYGTSLKERYIQNFLKP